MSIGQIVCILFIGCLIFFVGILVGMDMQGDIYSRYEDEEHKKRDSEECRKHSEK